MSSSTTPVRSYSPNNPFINAPLQTPVSNINANEIDLVFQHPVPEIHIANEIAPQLPERPSDSTIGPALPPRLPSRPVSRTSSRPPSRPLSIPSSPRLPERPPPALPERRGSNSHLNVDNNDHLDIPSPLYTPVASPNETMVPQELTSEIPAMALNDDISPDDAPPPYSEAPEELRSQIFTPPFSNTGGDRDNYQRPLAPPPSAHQYQRPLGPPPGQYQRPLVPPPGFRSGHPPRRLPPAPSGGYPGMSNATYGNAAYDSNRPPLPSRR